ncbi:L-ascorbate-6-phosphate lactonase UlaG [Fervidicola ferrireducens]|uniref:UPF0173 metal-dependent hydrolase AN618_09140 n=1 Tax=Fervidicola ferrireducens TaxID=520764 RepID=A0A140LAZ1_9FIRM|nr:metal-dependent hydrolase [Fervidicola ferrireducens]KXG77716.1 L-ascorbate-6-phosphate lactonase UlaG [Fervidicola ferrireducens]
MVSVTFHGHACFTISSSKFNLIIDPWLKDNPLSDIKPEQVKADYILVTHGHGDHLGDALEIAKESGATIIAPYELAVYCQLKGAKVHPMHIGGDYTFDFGWLQLTPAMHGSGGVFGEQIVYLGNPCGFLLEIEGKTLYHAGDTGLFGDMKLIGEKVSLDVAMLPIGGNFVMGIDDAVKAVEFLKPRTVIPMHYNTFDVIKKDPQEFKEKVEEKIGARVVILEPGETITL